MKLKAIATEPDDPNDEPVEEPIELPDQRPESQPNEPLDLPDRLPVLSGVHAQVSHLDSDQAAKVMTTAQKLGAPEAAVAQNLPDAEKVAAQPNDSIFAEIEKNYPGTTKYLLEPKNMAVAKDDLENLTAHEGLLNWIGDAYNSGSEAFESGRLQEELGMTMYRKMEGQPMPEGNAFQNGEFRLGAPDSLNLPTDPDKRSQAIEARLAELEKTKPQGFTLKHGLYGTVSFAPQIIGSVGYGAGQAGVGGAIGGLAGGAAGLAVGGLPGAMVGAEAGAEVLGTAGLGLGEMSYNYKFMTGLAYNDIKKIQDVDGNPIPDNIARIAAMATGGAAAGLSLVKLDAALGPAGKAFLNQFTAQTSKQVLENPATMRLALTNFAKSYAQNWLHFTGAMVGITATNILGQEGAKLATYNETGQAFEPREPGEIRNQLLTAAGDAALTGGIITLPGVGLSAAHDFKQARRAEVARDFTLALGSAAESSKLKERMSGRYREFVDQIAQGGPVENIHIPVEALKEYFQSKNIDTPTAMKELGVSESFEEAEKTGGDVQIPLGTWAEKMAGTEHSTNLANDIKFHPDDLSVNQVKQKRIEIERAMKALNELPASGGDTQVGANIEAQLKALGLSDREARLAGDMHQAFFGTAAERAGGQSALDLFKNYGIRIARGEGDVADPKLVTTDPKVFAPGVLADPEQLKAAVKTKARAEHLEQHLIDQQLDAGKRIEQAGGQASTRDIMMQKDAADGLKSLATFKDSLPDVEPKSYDQSPQASPKLSPLGFYSALENEVNKMNFGKIPAKELSGRIANLPGIKSEELEHTGIIDWLKAQDGHVTKEQVLKFLSDEGVKLEQVVLSENFKGGGGDGPTETDWGEPVRDEPSEDDYNSEYESYVSDDYWDQQRVKELRDELAPDHTGSDGEIDEASLENAMERQREERSWEWAKESVESDDYGSARYTVRDSATDWTLHGSDEMGWYSHELQREVGDNLEEAKVKLVAHMIERGELEGTLSDHIKASDIEWKEGKASAEPDIKVVMRKAKALFKKEKARFIREATENNRHMLNEDGSIRDGWTKEEHTAAILEEAKSLANEEVFRSYNDPSDKNNQVEFKINHSLIRGSIIGNDHTGYAFQLRGRTTRTRSGEMTPLGERVPLESKSIDAAKEEVLKLLADQGKISDGKPKDPKDAEEDIDRPTGRTKWTKYTEPGGTNQREILITMPGLGYKSSHWEHKDVVVHMRLSDRVDENGRKTLFIEEKQSDLNQEGREQGYQDEKQLAAEKEERNIASVKFDQAQRVSSEAYDNLGAYLKSAGYGSDAIDIVFNSSEPAMQKKAREKMGAEKYDKMTADPQVKALFEEYKRTNQEQKDAATHYHELSDRIIEHTNRVPDQPFKKTEAWSGLALKAVLRLAVKEGYDAVAWTPASVHVDRWGTDNVSWHKVEGGEFQIQDANGKPWKHFRDEKTAKAELEKLRNYQAEHIELSKRIRERTEKYTGQSNDFKGELTLGLKNGDITQAEVDRLGELNNLKFSPGGGDVDKFTVTEETPHFLVGSVEQRGGHAGGMDIEAAARARGELLERDGARVHTKEELREVISKTLGRERNDRSLGALTDQIWDKMQTENSGAKNPRAEGMQFFYDQMLPRKVAPAVLKKLDPAAKVEVAKFDTGKENLESWSIPITDKMREKIEQGQTYFQKPEPFYSKLERTIQQKMPVTAPAQDILGMIKEVKGEERKWSGIDEFLKGKEKVSKQELLDFIRGNQLKIEEVRKGGEGDGTLPEGYSVKASQSGDSFDVSNVHGAVISNGESEAEAISNFHKQRMDTGTKFTQYSLPGGKNHQEVLYILPEKQNAEKESLLKERDALDAKRQPSWRKHTGEDATRFRQIQDRLKALESDTKFTGSHWDEPNVLAHGRISVHTDVDGNVVLVLDELQSDWHKAGQKHGYKSPEGEAEKARIKKEVEALGLDIASADVHKIKEAGGSEKLAAEYMAAFVDNNLKGTIPDAPLKKTWHEFVLKKMLREAAEKGYDKLAWPGGEIQADRYSLEKQVKEIAYNKVGDKYHVQVFDHSDDAIYDKGGLEGSDLDGLVGKEMAAKIIAGEGSEGTGLNGGTTVLKGLDLKVGGEGMRAFYDKILPDYLNKFGKKFGARVGETELAGQANAGKYSAYPQPDMNGKFAVFRFNGDNKQEVHSTHDTLSDAESAAKRANAIKVHSIDITPEMRKSIMEEGFPLFQAGDKDALGRIRLKDGETLISLFQGANKSTFAHESAHLFLEVMGDLAEKPDAPEQIKADYATILKELGVNSRDEIQTPHHEQFAKSWEAYMMEGKAPSARLREVFSRMRDWLIKLYKNLDSLGVKPSPELKAVFDRMLATDEEITNAQHEIGYSPEILDHVSPEIQAKLSDLQHQARQTAIDQLLKERLGELKDEHQALLKSEKERLTKEAEKIESESPLNQATAQIKDGLGKQNVVDLATKLLDGRLKDQEQAHFEVAAEAHGFRDGRELALHIINDSTNDRRAERMKSMVEAGMQTHEMSPEQMKLKALESVHNDKMAELLSLEHGLLVDLIHKKSIQSEVSKRKREETRIEVALAKEQARKILDAKVIRQAGDFRKYVTAERNAAVKVARALKDGDFEKAADAKRSQMFAHALVSEALKNRAETAKALKFLGEWTKRGRDLKNMPYGFIRQIDQLVARFGLGESRDEDGPTMKAMAELMMGEGHDAYQIASETGLRFDRGAWTPEHLVDFVQRMNNDYYALYVPDSVLNGEHESYRDMTFGEMRDLKGAVEAIADIGHRYNHFLSFESKADLRAAAKEFRDSVEDKIGKPFEDRKRIGSGSGDGIGTKVDKILDAGRSFTLDLVNLATLTHFLDKESVDGPAKNYLYRPIKEAENRKFARYQKMTGEIDELFGRFYKPGELADYKKQLIHVDAIDGKLSKEEILALGLNWGNAGNRDRIVRGYKLSEEQVHSVLQHLDKRDWDFIQGTWDYLDTYWPEIKRLEMRINGVEPRRVEPLAVITPHGTYRGGYYPIAYDFTKSAEAYRNAEQKTELFKQFSAAAAHTEQGHTAERVSTVSRPVRLSLDVLFNHLNNVVHDLEFREAVIDVSRFLNQPDTRVAIENSLGIKGYRVIGDWLKSVASDQGETLSGAEKAFQWFRFKSSLAVLGLSTKALFYHFPGNIFNSMSEVGALRTGSTLTTALTDTVMGRGVLKEMVFSKSEMMKQRMTVRDRDIMELSNKWAGETKGVLATYAFSLLHFADEAVSVPLWADVYKQHIDLGEAKAKAIADEAIVRTLGSGSMVDRPAIMRGGELKKAMTMYYSWMSVMFNRAWMSGKLSGLAYDKGNVGQAAAIMAKSTFYLWLLPAAHEALVGEIFHNSTNNNDDDRKKRIAGTVLEHPFSMLPFWRGIMAPVIHLTLGERGHGDSYELSPAEGTINAVLKPIGEAANLAFTGKHPDEKFMQDAARGAAVLCGYPQQLNTWAFNFLDDIQSNGQATYKDILSRKTKH